MWTTWFICNPCLSLATNCIGLFPFVHPKLPLTEKIMSQFSRRFFVTFAIATKPTLHRAYSGALSRCVTGKRQFTQVVPSNSERRKTKWVPKSVAEGLTLQDFVNNSTETSTHDYQVLEAISLTHRFLSTFIPLALSFNWVSFLPLSFSLFLFFSLLASESPCIIILNFTQFQYVLAWE